MLHFHANFFLFPGKILLMSRLLFSHNPRSCHPSFVLNIPPFFHNATLFRHKYSTKDSDYNLIGYNLYPVDKRGTASPLDTPALLQPSPLATAHAPAYVPIFFLYFSHPKNTKKRERLQQFSARILSIFFLRSRNDSNKNLFTVHRIF